MSSRATAVVYVRLSVMTDASTSPERQRSECEAYAKRMGWDVTAVLEDLDVSGTKSVDDRPGLSQALALVEAGQANYLVALKIDRVARSLVNFSEIVDRVDKAGATLVLVQESLDFSTPAGRMVASVLASFAQFESESIGARVRGAQAHLREVGKWRGGRRPYGWTPEPAPDGKGKVLVLHGTEAPILRDIALRCAEGERLNVLAAELNSSGVVTAQAKAWVAATLRKALTKPLMYGDGGEALISHEEYAALQLAITPKSRPAYTSVESLLSPDLLSCGACGSAMGATTRSGRPIYRCKKRMVPGVPGGCNAVASRNGVDRAVEQEVLRVAGRAHVEMRQTTELVDQSAEVRAELEQALSNLARDRYEGGLFKGEDGERRFRETYERLEAQIAELPGPVEVTSEAPPIPTGKKFGEAWADADEATRAAWLSSMLEEVQVAPGKAGRGFDSSRVSIHWAS